MICNHLNNFVNFEEEKKIKKNPPPKKNNFKNLQNFPTSIISCVLNPNLLYEIKIWAHLRERSERCCIIIGVAFTAYAQFL